MYYENKFKIIDKSMPIDKKDMFDVHEQPKVDGIIKTVLSSHL